MRVNMKDEKTADILECDVCQGDHHALRADDKGAFICTNKHEPINTGISKAEFEAGYINKPAPEPLTRSRAKREDGEM